MEIVDWVLIAMATVSVCIMLFGVFKDEPSKTKRPPTPKVRAHERPNVQHVVPRRPVICSVELSSDDIFEAIVNTAAIRSGRDDLTKRNWEVTLYYTENKVKLKGAVVEFQDDNVKKRGKLWLVKG